MTSSEDAQMQRRKPIRHVFIFLYSFLLLLLFLHLLTNANAVFLHILVFIFVVVITIFHLKFTLYTPGCFSVPWWKQENQPYFLKVHHMKLTENQISFRITTVQLQKICLFQQLLWWLAIEKKNTRMLCSFHQNF